MNDGYELRSVRIGAVIAIAALAAFLVWFFAIRDTGDNDSAENEATPVAVTQAEISDLAQKDDQPIYWAGNQPGTTDLELTQTRDGNVYLRYLTDDASIGTPKPSYLTVGTYPFGDAVHAVKTIAKEPGAKTFNVPNGGFAVQNTSSPTSVYVAYPDDRRFEIEVYDPDPATALDLVKSGVIQRAP
ncbi:MAG: hypothetical protein ACJ75I_10250 [Solirubrobacterales bacterium]